MTNNDQSFTPCFSSKDGDQSRVFKEIVAQKSQSDSASVFNEGAGVSPVSPLGNEVDSMPSFDSLANDIESLLGEEQNTEQTKLSLSDLGYSSDQFEQILSEVDGMPAGGGNTHISGVSGVMSMLDDDDEDFVDSEQGEISDELREAIYAEGYMAGSLSQKEVMDKRIKELEKTVANLKISASTPAMLSEDINLAISEFIREVSRSLLSGAKEKLLAEIVESRVEEFVADVKAWELVTNVYCPESEFNDLKEIFGEDDLSNYPIEETAEPIGFIRKSVHYILDRELSGGRFRLEIERENAPKIEAVMELDSHLAAIEDLLGEAI